MHTPCPKSYMDNGFKGVRYDRIMHLNEIFKYFLHPADILGSDELHPKDLLYHVPKYLRGAHRNEKFFMVSDTGSSSISSDFLPNFLSRRP